MTFIKRFSVILVLGFLIVLACHTILEAQETSDKTEQMQQRQELLEQWLQEEKAALEKSSQETTPKNIDSEVKDPTAPPAPPIALPNQHPTKEKYLKALEEYYAYRISGLQHRSKVFKWQLFSSKIIFVTVLLLVALGIYFAAVQFHVGLRGKGKADGENQGQQTELVASFKGIKVSSPVLGVIILVISLAFFYLYLVYVYPIEEIF